MNDAASPKYLALERMAFEQDQRISDVVKREQSRLRNFIRRRVPDPGDAEDILQDVFYRLVEANRLLMPSSTSLAGCFASPAIASRIYFARRSRRISASSTSPAMMRMRTVGNFEDLLPSPDAGPEAQYVRKVLLDELQRALAELPKEQRDVFLAHEFEGRSFKEIAHETGVSINTLLSRKRYAVLHLRERLQRVYEDFVTR